MSGSDNWEVRLYDHPDIESVLLELRGSDGEFRPVLGGMVVLQVVEIRRKPKVERL